MGGSKEVKEVNVKGENCESIKKYFLPKMKIGKSETENNVPQNSDFIENLVYRKPLICLVKASCQADTKPNEVKQIKDTNW